MEYKDQLNEAEKALWQIFNIIERSRKNKTLEEIKQVTVDYINNKVNDKTKERGDKK